MSKSCGFHRMAQETTPQGNPTISILIDDPKTQTQTGGPISPSLTPHEINELWDDVRANTGIVQEATEDSTQDSSNPQGIRTGTRKQRVRTNEQDSDFTATDLKDIYAIVQDDAQFSEKDLENLDRYLPSKIKTASDEETPKALVKYLRLLSEICMKSCKNRNMPIPTHGTSRLLRSSLIKVGDKKPERCFLKSQTPPAVIKLLPTNDFALIQVLLLMLSTRR
jgi:hypothetical protein